MACPSPGGFVTEAADVSNRWLLICFLLAPLLTSVFKRGKENLKLSFQPSLGINEATFSPQYRAWILTLILNSGTAGLSRVRVSKQ